MVKGIKPKVEFIVRKKDKVEQPVYVASDLSIHKTTESLSKRVKTIKDKKDLEPERQKIKKKYGLGE